MFQDFIQRLLKEAVGEQSPSGETTIEIPKEISSTFVMTVEEMDISMADAAPGLLLSCTVAPLPATENPLPIFMMLLRGCFLGQTTRNARLGLTEDGSQVVLARHLPLIKNYQEFRDAVEDFTNAACFWKARLAEAGEGKAIG